MPTISADKLQKVLVKRLRAHWRRPKIVGFMDPVYRTVSGAYWNEARSTSPEVDYLPNIYDCEDIAMEFKLHAIREQVRLQPQVKDPMAVGLGMGFFRWMPQGELHVANFAILDDWTLEWFDLATRKAYPKSHAKRIKWVMI